MWYRKIQALQMLLKESLPKAKVKACKVISNAFGTFQNLSCSSPRHTHPCPGTCTHTHTQSSQPCMKVNVSGWGWHPRYPPAGCTLHQTPPVELHKPPLLLSGWVSPDSSSLTLTQWAGLRWGLSASEPHFLSLWPSKSHLALHPVAHNGWHRAHINPRTEGNLSLSSTPHQAQDRYRVNSRNGPNPSPSASVSLYESGTNDSACLREPQWRLDEIMHLAQYPAQSRCSINWSPDIYILRGPGLHHLHFLTGYQPRLKAPVGSKAPPP